MGEELERYKLEWVVTSSTPVLQFRVEWKMVGREKSEWQSEIVEVRKKILLHVLGNLEPNLTPFLCKIKKALLWLNPLFTQLQHLYIGGEGWC